MGACLLSQPWVVGVMLLCGLPGPSAARESCVHSLAPPRWLSPWEGLEGMEQGTAPVLRAKDPCVQAGEVIWGQIVTLTGKFSSGGNMQANDVCVLGALKWRGDNSTASWSCVPAGKGSVTARVTS